MTVFRNDRIHLTTAQMRALVRHGGTLFTDIGGAIPLIPLDEPGYPTRLYVPRADSRIDCLRPSPTRLFKGDMQPDAVWSCKASYPAMAAISTYLSFEHPQLTLHIEEHRTGR